MKVCKKCGEDKPLTEYSPCKTTKDRLRNWCRACFASYDKQRYTTISKRHWRGKSLVRYWPGSTPEQALLRYAELFQAQWGVCAICKQPESAKTPQGQVKALHVDHDHTTNKVRGLLCTNCNKGLGDFKDNSQWLQAAINYLRKSNEDL